MKSLNLKQVLFFGFGLLFLAAAVILGWQGLEKLGENQQKFQELTDQLGNEALASILVDPDGVKKTEKAAKEIRDFNDKLEKETTQLRQTWEQSSQLASASEQDWFNDPGKWKNRLIQIQSDVQKEAKQANLRLAPDFYLGFEAYRQKSPTSEEIPNLGLELSLASELVDKVIDSRKKAKEQFPTICELRSLTLLGAEKDSAPVPPSKEEKKVGLPDRSRKSFRLQMDSSPEVFYLLIQNLMQDDGLWIVRDLNISNPRQSFSSRSEIAQRFSSPKENLAKEEASSGKLLEILAGSESLSIQLDVDFVIFARSKGNVAKDPTKEKQP